jgi:hypothetical protein
VSSPLIDEPVSLRRRSRSWASAMTSAAMSRPERVARFCSCRRSRVWAVFSSRRFKIVWAGIGVKGFADAFLELSNEAALGQVCESSGDFVWMLRFLAWQDRTGLVGLDGLLKFFPGGCFVNEGFLRQCALKFPVERRTGRDRGQQGLLCSEVSEILSQGEVVGGEHRLAIVARAPFGQCQNGDA